MGHALRVLLDRIWAQTGPARARIVQRVHLERLLFLHRGVMERRIRTVQRVLRVPMEHTFQRYARKVDSINALRVTRHAQWGSTSREHAAGF